MIKRFLASIMAVAGLFSLSGCTAAAPDVTPETAMVDLLGEIRQYTQERDPHFQILGNGAAGLLEETPDNSAANVQRLIASMDGFLTESVYYTSDEQGKAKPQADDYVAYLHAMFAKPKAAGKAVWTSDYIKDPQSQDTDEKQGRADGYVSMAVANQKLDIIPVRQVPFTSDKPIYRIQDAQNFLFLLNPGSFSTKAEYLTALDKTPYDVIVVDLYYGDSPLTKADVDSLRTKPQGGQRLILAYMSLGEAADYRPYWKSEWNTKRPDWIRKPNPDWPGSYKVCYWSPQWKHLLYGHDGAYLDQIMGAGFDGVFLDVIDAWQYFAKQ